MVVGEQGMAEQYVGKEAELNHELMEKHKANLIYPTRVSRRLQCQPLRLRPRQCVRALLSGSADCFRLAVGVGAGRVGVEPRLWVRLTQSAMLRLWRRWQRG